MAEPLSIIDLLLAASAACSAILLGLRAAAGRRTRWPLIITAVLVTARLAVAALLWTEDWYLVSDRIIVGLPAAAVPLAAAAWATAARRFAAERVAGQVASVGVLISAYLAWVPQDPADRSLTVAVVICLLAATGVTAAGLLRWRAHPSRAARLPWLTTLTILGAIAAITGLYQQNQAPPAAAAQEHAGHGVAVAMLTGPRQATPDVRFTLVAARGTVQLLSGRQVDALTFNGAAPGPTLRVRQGQLVEVTLLNTDVAEGVTVHWHGVDVPNAEDGVPGLTQDPVLPGGRFVYRFVPDRAGTFWYHTHRDSQNAVSRGLFGAFLVDPPGGSVDGKAYEVTVFAHQWPIGEDLIGAFDTADTPTRQSVDPGQPVRLRLANSSQDPQRIQVTGTTYQVAAIDGNAVHEPGPVPSGSLLLLAAGGRYDITFDMPATPVAISMHTNEKADTATRLLIPNGNDDAAPHPTGTGPMFDPARYGTPDGTAPPATAHRTYNLVLDNGFGFSGGTFTWANTVNGRLWPAIPNLAVSLGDIVRIRITNRGIIDHPMHLHGHRVRVLSRNGTPMTGSPWWTDTLNVAPGQTYEISFTADSPGIWMDHCHNFEHATGGMVWHLSYTGINAPAHSTHIPE